MPKAIFRDDVRKLREDRALLVEVLPREEYEEEHLPGAINIPLRELTRETTVQLRHDAPVIVYCHDYLWDMSPRAAWRLESLGFTQVFDYVPGKADWFASGLPREGTLASVPTIGEAARRDVPTCRPQDKIRHVREHVQEAGWDRCVVVNEERVVLGLLREKELGLDDAVSAEQVMYPGPTTFRPNVAAEKMAERMRKRGTSSVLVTTPDGRLIGLLYREDAERLAGV
jgi:rhodanese-related sulfurtransferase/CBS domain-containing protein